MRHSRIPLSTYRLQFNSQFRFADARRLVPYLHTLGITDIYASPLLQAKRGSAHGYDVTDPSRLNPELGSDEDFDALVHELQQHGMGLLLDIVPNHMAASVENPWWVDLLEEGRASIFASHFDVDWDPPNRLQENKVLLPILGRPYSEVLESQELRLEFERDGFFISYYDFKLPVAARTCRIILQHRVERLRRRLGDQSPAFQELQGIVAALGQLRENAPSAASPGERRQQRQAAKERLWDLYSSSREFHRFLDDNVRLFNGRPGISSSFVLMDRLLSDQAYVLAYWQDTNKEINYRRFFTITDLVGVRAEDPLTFDSIHAVLLRLTEKGMVTGLRIDHVDGLRDPLGYLRRLQERLRREEARPSDSKEAGRTAPAENQFYVVVEKILGEHEELRREWPVSGTTGYQFLNFVNGLFVDERHARSLDGAYARFLARPVNYDDLVYAKKKQVMASLLAVEIRALGRYLSVLAERDRYARELPRQQLTLALLEITACLEVYRTYVRSFEVAAEDRRYIESALQRAERRDPTLNPLALRFLRQVLLLEFGPQVLPEQREATLHFVMRWQQFTGPIMAKGFEDSLLYVYNRLASLNEVGGSPQSNGIPPAALHEYLRRRQARWPGALNATTTHDTKRSEDVRARINVLSEIPLQWERRAQRWARQNRKKKVKALAGAEVVPTPNEEYLLYQNLLGAWPSGEAAVAPFRQRMKDYMIKATREAMVHTRWTRPNLEHENAVVRFVEAILDDSGPNRFLQDFREFERFVSFAGALNSLAQVLLKICSPGIPDFYQGSELWDLRLVDPDNRGAVDFQLRSQALQDLKRADVQRSTLIEELLPTWRDGRAKLYVIYRALNFRRQEPELFLRGNYVPLRIAGKHRENAFAFMRQWGKHRCLVVTPRLVARLITRHRAPLGRKVWGATALILPEGSPSRWENLLTGEVIDAKRRPGVCYLHQVFSRFPLALLAPAPR
jgi:(1->4)-alpha-D-glucan 1-alpha-D-glucosylmutase